MMYKNSLDHHAIYFMKSNLFNFKVRKIEFVYYLQRKICANEVQVSYDDSF